MDAVNARCHHRLMGHLAAVLSAEVEGGPMDPRFPSWMRTGNSVMRGMQKMGISLGPVRVLTIAGRKSGQPRSTPVTPVELDGVRYVLSLRDVTDWEKNARAAGEGTLAKGRHVEQIRLRDVADPDLKKHVIRQFATKVPQGTGFYVRFGVAADSSPDSMASASEKISVFEITPA